MCLSAVALSVPAHADKQAYCQAYARDFADGIAKDKAGWDHKFQIALDNCMGPKVGKQEAAAPVVAPAPAAKPKAVAVAAKPPVVAPAVNPAQEQAKAEEPAAKPAEAEKLTPGTEAFNDYCAKKYTSFDPKSGMYLSHTGVKRRCLVTKDFRG